MKDLTKLTPVEIDTELARLWGEMDRIDSYRIEYVRRVRKGEAGDRFYAREIEENRAKVAEYGAEIAKLRIEAEPFNDEFTRRGGWHRYFLVTNGNGHVHREMHCHTCYPTTRYAWLIDLADCDEVAMIEEWGEKACTVCFPDAPTNPLYNRPSRRDREAREAREAEKRTREEAKRKKAEAAAERAAKAEAKKAKVEAEKAAGTYKLTPTERRGEAVSAISKAYYGDDYGANPDWAKVREAAEAAEAAGRAAGWKNAVARVAKAAEAEDGSWMTQLIINLSHEI